MVSIGSIINGGFRLFREQPIAVLVWGVINGLIAAGSSILTPEIMRAQLTGPAGGGSPEAFLLWMLPLYLAMMVVGLVITAAAFRAVMRPTREQQRLCASAATNCGYSCWRSSGL